MFMNMCVCDNNKDIVRMYEGLEGEKGRGVVVVI